MTYDELTTFGLLRKVNKLGENRVMVEGDEAPKLEPKLIAEKYVVIALRI
jgi:hypothetical protein